MLRKLAISMVGLFALTANAQAGMITDTVNQNEKVNYFQSYGYQHNLNDEGFVLGSAVSGNLSIDIRDDGGFGDLWETILFTIEDFDLDTGDLSLFGGNFDGDLEVEALAAINSDGFLDVTITSLFGDFYVGKSVLTVVTSDVPEPGTLALLGAGLLGLVAARKRRGSMA